MKEEWEKRAKGSKREGRDGGRIKEESGRRGRRKGRGKKKKSE